MINRSNKSNNKKRLIKNIIITVALFFIFMFAIRRYQNNEIQYTNINDKNSIAYILDAPNKSIYNIKSLDIAKLKGRAVLLNIYNIKDFSYIFTLDIVNNIEKNYQNKLAVIDIIIDEDGFNKDLIVNYIIKNSIKRPIITLSSLDLKSILKENTNMAIVLADERGNIKNTFYYDQINENNLKNQIDSLLSNKKIKNNNMFNLSLEKDKAPESFIKSLTFIKYLRNIGDTNEGPYFIISDGEGRKIYFLKLNGEIVKQIGNGISGKNDAMANNSTFCYPSGLAISNSRTLYIADMCNDSIREVNLKTLKTSTLVENNDLLKKPISLELLDDKLIIATGYKNSLLSYNLTDKTLDKIECQNCLLNINKLTKYDNKLYFINKSDAKIYTINNKLKIEEYKKIENFKDYNINSFNIDETGIYFVDKYTNKILKLDSDENIVEYSSNIDEDLYKLPTDIIDLKDKLYITNEGDKKIIELDKNTKAINAISIKFGYEYNKLKITEGEFLDINNIEDINIKSEEKDNKILINLEDNFIFEKMAPQSILIFEEDKENNSAILIKSYSKNEILANKTLSLPSFKDKKMYYIKGTFYYCGKEKETPCLINNYLRRIIPANNERNTNINVNFLY